VLARLFVALALLTLFAAPAVVPHAAAGEPGAVPFLQVRIDSITPEVVTTTSEPTVTVTGSILNVGDRPVHDVMVRLEHAAAVTSSAGLRTNLTGNVDQYEPVADFITVAPELLRGQDVPFNLNYPLRSAELSSLHIDKPGVYPVMVNVNGTPDYGAPARLDDARFLLPVLGVPPEPAADSAADTLTVVVPPDTSKPVRLTMLWPLADRPRLAAGAPGGTTPVRLIDDDLATSLAPGGRLDTLLSAVDFATSPPVDPSGEVRLAMCIAVDPDLLVTVNAMTGGYVVNDAPDAGPSTPTHPGAGRDAAVGWLNRLKGLAQRIYHGNVPQVLQFQNNFIPAQATSAITYAANLPTQPKTQASTAAASATITSAGGINPSDFSTNPLKIGSPAPPVDASITGTAVNNQAAAPVPITAATALSGTAPSDSLAAGFAAGDTITVDGTTITFVASGATGNQLNITDNVGALLNKISAITGAAATVSTAAARAALPATVPHADATFTAGRATLLGAALASGSGDLFAEALADRIHEPYRADGAPLLAVVREQLPAGALGSTLSGSGPTVVVWARPDTVEACATELEARFPDVAVHILNVSPRGAHVDEH